MGLFGKKNKDTETASCSCGGNCNPEAPVSSGDKNTKIEGASVKIQAVAAPNATSLKLLQKKHWSSLEWIQQLNILQIFHKQQHMA